MVEWRIDVDCDARLKNGRDGFGNETQMLYIDGPIDHIGLTVTGEVLTEDRAGMVARRGRAAATVGLPAPHSTAPLPTRPSSPSRASVEASGRHPPQLRRTG